MPSFNSLVNLREEGSPLGAPGNVSYFEGTPHRRPDLDGGRPHHKYYPDGRAILVDGMMACQHASSRGRGHGFDGSPAQQADHPSLMAAMGALESPPGH